MMAQAETQAFYLQSQLEISPQWKTLAGFRWDRFALTYHNRVTDERLHRKPTKMLSYRFGITSGNRPRAIVLLQLRQFVQPIWRDLLA